MNLPTPIHDWNQTPAAAIQLQRQLAARIIESPLPRAARLAAGGDVAFNSEGDRLIAAWVVWDIAAHTIVETAFAHQNVTFPYVPGLLSFREAPALIEAARLLSREPDVFILDGHGKSHPRRFGLACHVGLFLDRPAIGCAKSRLCGQHREPGSRAGGSCRLVVDGETLGRVVRTREGAKPIYISIGHRMVLANAVSVTRRCCMGYRMPEPTRQAHLLVTRLRTELF
ncbi:MAG: endonuclease V [Phycisphaerae bacterium]|nr:endonuclease V [Phycisphaerae bacterium]